VEAKVASASDKPHFDGKEEEGDPANQNPIAEASAVETKVVDPWAVTEDDFFPAMRQPKPLERKWTRKPRATIHAPKAIQPKARHVSKASQAPKASQLPKGLAVGDIVPTTMAHVTHPDRFAATEEDFYASSTRPRPYKQPKMRKPKSLFVEVPSPLHPACFVPEWTRKKAIAGVAGFAYMSNFLDLEIKPGPSFKAKWGKRGPKRLDQLPQRVAPPPALPTPVPSFPPGLEPPAPREVFPYLRLTRGVLPCPGEWGPETTFTHVERIRGSLERVTLPAPLVPDGARRLTYAINTDHTDRLAHTTTPLWHLPALDELVIHIIDSGPQIPPDAQISGEPGNIEVALYVPRGQPWLPYSAADGAIRGSLWFASFFDRLADSIAAHLPHTRTNPHAHQVHDRAGARRAAAALAVGERQPVRARVRPARPVALGHHDVGRR
jgi:hypothetical protein